MLHSFTGPDGENPESTVTLDAKGNLYGTTPNGGANIAGVVFRIANASATKEPGPVFKVLHSFGKGFDGAGPIAGVSIDAKGNLWIPTEFGGTYGNGALCKVTLMSEGEISEGEIVFHEYNFDVDGANPTGGRIFQVKQNFYEYLADPLTGGTDENGPAQGTIVIVVLHI